MPEKNSIAYAWPCGCRLYINYGPPETHVILTCTDDSHQGEPSVAAPPMELLRAREQQRHL